MSKKKSFLSVNEMVEMALLVALAIILDLDGLKITLSADGGSIGFTMVPLFILAYRHGFVKGVIGIGIVYGLLTCILDGHGMIYYPFDYFIAYGLSIPFAGIFAKLSFKKIDNKYGRFINIGYYVISVFIAGIIRVIGHSISSMVFYDLNIGGALAYNIPYVGSSIAICLVILLVLYPTILLLNKRFPTNFTKKIS